MKFLVHLFLVAVTAGVLNQTSHAQTVAWTYTVQPPAESTSSFVLDIKADSLGGAAMILRHRLTGQPFANQFVWISSKGKVLHTATLGADQFGEDTRIFRVSPTTVIVQGSGDNTFQRYTLRKGKVVTGFTIGEDFEVYSVDNSAFTLNQVPAMADSTGFFALEIKEPESILRHVSQIRRYRN